MYSDLLIFTAKDLSFPLQVRFSNNSAVFLRVLVQDSGEICATQRINLAVGPVCGQAAKLETAEKIVAANAIGRSFSLTPLHAVAP